MNKTPKLASASPPGLRVVPVAGQRVIVESTHLSTAVLGGIVGAAIEHAATDKKRTALAERLNREAKDFQPEVILAEECVRLLRGASPAWARGAVLYPESVVMPGGSELLTTETGPFKEGSKHYNKWLFRVLDWRKGPPVVPVGQATTAGVGTLTLEVGHQMIRLNHGNKVETAALFRLLDSPSGNVAGARFVGHSYKVRPVTLESDPAAFVEDFRQIASQLAKEALTQLKLLQGR